MPPPTILGPVLLPTQHLQGPCDACLVPLQVPFLPPLGDRALAEQEALAGMQNLITHSPVQQQDQLMDTSGTVVAPSKAAASEMPSEQ